MQTLIMTLHIIVCVTVVVLVLLQSGKEGMGVIFGGGGNSVFGSGGAGGVLAKLTAFLGVIFIVTCLSYNILISPKTAQQSTILNIQLEEMPAAPEPTPSPVHPPASSEENAVQPVAEMPETTSVETPQQAETPTAGEDSSAN